MLKRQAQSLLRRRLRDYPAVALVGPRQCGKTTLSRTLSGLYFDLEQESERLRLDLAWSEIVDGTELVILDEAQAWPDIFPRLRGAIDGSRKQMGRFLLLGSVSPALMTRVSESLAGRLSIVELTPLLLGELTTRTASSRRWLMGGFPDGGVRKARAFPQWQRDYLALLTQRDLPAWGLPAKPQVTMRLLRMLAAVHAQVWNASEIGKSLGLSYHTVNSYMDYLEGAFLVRRLAALHANIGKRLTKRPKVYWRDAGLLHALLRVADEDELLAHPRVGSSFEGYVINQVLGTLEARGVSFDAWFFRTSDGREVDLVLEMDGSRWAIEIKLTASPGPGDLARLDQVADLIDASDRVLVCRIPTPSPRRRRMVVDLPTLLNRLPRK